MAFTATTTDIVLALLAVAILAQLARRPGLPPKPPGPRGYPIIGNTLELPSSYEWRTFSEWGEVYGDFMSVSAFGNTIVVINSYKRAKEIFEDPRKNTVYSSRPYVAMTGDLMGYDKIMGLLPYGATFRNARKYFQKELGSNAGVKNFYPQEEQQAKAFIRRVLNSPDDLLEHTFHHAAAIILRIAYGYDAKETNDRMVIGGNEAMESFNQSSLPGKFLVNQIPILRYIPAWVPGAGFQKVAADWKKLTPGLTEAPFQFAKDQIAAGTAEESFVVKWLGRNLSASAQNELMQAAGSMFGGGGETTAITVYFFFIILAQRPDIQAKAQAEVDEVVGRERLPTFEDRERMPYLAALTKEILRCHPVVPMGIPHSTLEDDIHDGYFIPKGSTILANIWQMCNDPDVYQNPDTFNVERFLGDNPEADPGLVVFGFGRRVCPGRLLADASLYITFAMILWSFDVSPIKVDGKSAPPVYSPVSGLVSRIEPVELFIAPRTNTLGSLVSKVSHA